MAELIDVRGLSCPQPVINTLRKMEELVQDKLVVLADTGTARDNIIRMATGKGWQAEVTEENEEFRILLNKGQ